MLYIQFIENNKDLALKVSPTHSPLFHLSFYYIKFCNYQFIMKRSIPTLEHFT